MNHCTEMALLEAAAPASTVGAKWVAKGVAARKTHILVRSIGNEAKGWPDNQEKTREEILQETISRCSSRKKAPTHADIQRFGTAALFPQDRRDMEQAEKETSNNNNNGGSNDGNNNNNNGGSNGGDDDDDPQNGGGGHGGSGDGGDQAHDNEDGTNGADTTIEDRDGDESMSGYAVLCWFRFTNKQHDVCGCLVWGIMYHVWNKTGQN
jgi:hypothetical protein